MSLSQTPTWAIHLLQNISCVCVWGGGESKRQEGAAVFWKKKGKLTSYQTYSIPDTVILWQILSHLILRKSMWNICSYPILSFQQYFMVNNFKHKKLRQSYNKSPCSPRTTSTIVLSCCIHSLPTLLTCTHTHIHTHIHPFSTDLRWLWRKSQSSGHFISQVF